MLTYNLQGTKSEPLEYYPKEELLLGVLYFPSPDNRFEIALDRQRGEPPFTYEMPNPPAGVDFTTVEVQGSMTANFMGFIPFGKCFE